MDSPGDHPMASILVVDDDPQLLGLYAAALRQYRVTCVPTGTAALESLARELPDVILLDHVLGDGERGLDYLPRLKDAAAHVPVIIVSGSLLPEEQIRALQGPRAASFLLSKPFDLRELQRMIEIALTECGLGEAVRVLQSLERREKTDDIEPDRRFVERLARQHAILKRLRATAEPVSISRLSRILGVSRRTIARDLRELVQRGQIPASLTPDVEVDGAGLRD